MRPDPHQAARRRWRDPAGVLRLLGTRAVVLVAASGAFLAAGEHSWQSRWDRVDELLLIGDEARALIAAQAIVLAAMSNTIVKGAMVMIGGANSLRKTILPGLLLILTTGIVTAILFI